MDSLLGRVRAALDLPPPAPGVRVAIAMSGGVDSSTTAALLKHFGYEVVGMTLRLYSGDARAARPGACCAGKDIYDAKAVADRMGFPHYVLDFEARFKEKVIDPFMESYFRGETPVPCVLCNQTVKFEDLLDRARDLGASSLITGHYVQRVVREGVAQMIRGVDPRRDQSYFLYGTTREQLDFLRFPLGGLVKDETRQLADFFGLHIAQKPDSQDICFVASGSYRDFLEKCHPERFVPGDIVHMDGRTLGQHKGIARYTVGQRRGLGIGGCDPLFVVSVCPDKNQVVVGPRQALGCQSVVLSDVNWLTDLEALLARQVCHVRFRSSHEPLPATVRKDGEGQVIVTFTQPQEGVSAGQACVFYVGKQLLGGGWIAATLSEPFTNLPNDVFNRHKKGECDGKEAVFLA